MYYLVIPQEDILWVSSHKTARGGKESTIFLSVITQCVPITTYLIHIPNHRRPQATLWSQPNPCVCCSPSPLSKPFFFPLLAPNTLTLCPKAWKKFKALFSGKLGPYPKASQRRPPCLSRMGLHVDTENTCTPTTDCTSICVIPITWPSFIDRTSYQEPMWKFTLNPAQGNAWLSQLLPRENVKGWC